MVQVYGMVTILHLSGADSFNFNILSNALLNRSEDTLEELDLSSNRAGDVYLGELVL